MNSKLSEGCMASRELRLPALMNNIEHELEELENLSCTLVSRLECISSYSNITEVVKDSVDPPEESLPSTLETFRSFSSRLKVLNKSLRDQLTSLEL